MQMAIIIHQVLKHHRTDNMILSAQTGVSEGGAESLFIWCGAARRERHVSVKSALQRAHTERQRGKRAPYAGSSRLASETRQIMDSDAGCCHFGWGLCNFTSNHGLLLTAPPCDTLRTDTGFLPYWRISVRLLWLVRPCVARRALGWTHAHARIMDR